MQNIFFSFVLSISSMTPPTKAHQDESIQDSVEKLSRTIPMQKRQLTDNGTSLWEEHEHESERPDRNLSISPSYTKTGENCLIECIGLDCEFVGVGPGGKRSVLARVSVVSSDGTCKLDTYVQVREKVTDFRR
jgi:hypothetical protein